METEAILTNVMDISTPAVDKMNVQDEPGQSNGNVSSKKHSEVFAESNDKIMQLVIEKASLQETNQKHISESNKVKFNRKNAIKIRSETCKFNRLVIVQSKQF